MIDNARKFIFVHIPKTAGTSIEYSLRNEWPYTTAETSRGRKHKKLQNYITDIPSPYIWEKKLRAEIIQNEYFTFSIVRNPWERAVSHYHFFKTTIRRDYGKQKYTNSFKEFIEHYTDHNNRTGWIKNDFSPQLDYLTINGNISVDFVGRYERLQQDFNIISGMLGRPLRTLNHIYKSNRAPYVKYYCNETIRMVYRRYEQDIEYFKYRFNG